MHHACILAPDLGIVCGGLNWHASLTATPECPTHWSTASSHKPYPSPKSETLTLVLDLHPTLNPNPNPKS